MNFHFYPAVHMVHNGSLSGSQELHENITTFESIKACFVATFYLPMQFTITIVNCLPKDNMQHHWNFYSNHYLQFTKRNFNEILLFFFSLISDNSYAIPKAHHHCNLQRLLLISEPSQLRSQTFCVFCSFSAVQLVQKICSTRSAIIEL